MLKGFDVLTDPNKQVRKETVIGGVITLIALAITVLLFLNEYSNFEGLRVDKNLYLDPKPNEETVEVSLRIKLFSAPCGILSLDLLDDLRHHRVDVNINKIKIDKNVNVIGDVSL